MDETLREQIGIYVSRLDSLIQRGDQLHDTLENMPAEGATVAALRAWQEDCGVTINQLSGGSKAHWLARSFSDAFLMRSSAGQAVEVAAPQVIVQRLIKVLKKAATSLSSKEDESVLSASQEPAARRFDFVDNPDLRPVLEQAYTESRLALEQGDYDAAMRTSCGILEAIVTDALERKGLSALAASGAPEGKIADWPFETRLVVAEKAGLIRGGCARLPDVARAYRNDRTVAPAATVSESDARKTGQVLHVIMRDLNPGR